MHLWTTSDIPWMAGRPADYPSRHKKNADRRPSDRCTGTGTLTVTATPKWELRSRYQPNKVASSTSKAGVMTVHEQKVEQLTTLAAQV